MYAVTSIRFAKEILARLPSTIRILFTLLGYTIKVNIHFIAIDIYQQKVLTSQNLPAKIRRKNVNFGRFC